MISAFVLATAVIQAVGAESALSARIDEIFAVVEADSSSSASRAAIQQKLNKLAPKKDDDYRLRYAYILALLHENRQADALREATALAKAKPNYLPAQRLRASLLLSQKKYAEALPALEGVARLIPSPEAQGELEFSYIEAAQFLGTALGFLEGPGEKLVKEPLRVQYKTRIESRLNGKRRAAFDAQVAAVAELFADIRQDGEEAFARRDQENIESLQSVQQEEAEVAEARRKNEAAAEKTAQQLRAEWERLQTEWATLRENYTNLTAQAITIQNQRSAAIGQLSALQNPPKDKDGNVSQQARKEYDRWAPRLQQSISTLENQIARAALTMENMTMRGAALEAEMARLVVAGQAAGETFSMQDQLFAQKAKALAGRETRTKKKGGKGPKVNERAYQYGTYDEFSYEAEKQRLLDSLVSS